MNICPIHNITIKAGHTQCRACFIGEVEYKKEKERLKKVRTKRHKSNTWRKQWRKRICEMGYMDCILRGYCNGDC